MRGSVSFRMSEGDDAPIRAGPDDEVFFVPHGDEIIIHAPLHGVSALVDPRAADCLEDSLRSGTAVRLDPSLRPLAERLQRTPANPPATPSGDFVPRQLSLLPTIDCNLACRYCGVEAGASSVPAMSHEVCDAALTLHADVVRRHRLRSFTVYYFGGEPFTAMEIVRHADARGRDLAAAIGVPYRSTCTTNGFLSPRVARWLAQHLSYAVVSIDGPAELHDRYRPSCSGGPSHRTVAATLRVFAEGGLPYALRCTVDAAAVSELARTVDYLCREFRPTVINVEAVTPVGRCGLTGIAAPDPKDLVAAVVGAGRVARTHGVGLKLSTVQTERVLRSYCGTADDNLVVTPDGMLSSCFHVNHRGSLRAADFGFGEIDQAAGCLRIDRARLHVQRRRGMEALDRCKGCFARWHCAGGCALFHGANGAEAEARCRTIRALTRWRLLERMRLFDRADQVTLNDELSAPQRSARVMPPSTLSPLGAGP